MKMASSDYGCLGLLPSRWINCDASWIALLLFPFRHINLEKILVRTHIFCVLKEKVLLKFHPYIHTLCLPLMLNIWAHLNMSSVSRYFGRVTSGPVSELTNKQTILHVWAHTDEIIKKKKNQTKDLLGCEAALVNTKPPYSYS